MNHLLEEFLSSSATSAKALETLLFEHAEPLIRKIVWRRLSGSVLLQDREDTTGDALVELIARLESWRRGEAGPIANFLAYVAVTAHHSCDHYLRGLVPRQYRLRSRLRYLLDTSPGYALWDKDPGSVVCGYAKQTGQPAKRPEPGWRHSVSVKPGATEDQIVAAIFSEVSPLLFDDLAEAAGHLSGVSNDAPVDWNDVEATVADRGTDIGEKLDQRRALEVLWIEICELPVPQRIALMLNLRDEQGVSPLATFPALGIASMRQIASALQLAPEDLAAIWGRLPISDLEIAERLSLERQQVINLRKSARQRLARRTGGNITPVSSSSRNTGGRG